MASSHEDYLAERYDTMRIVCFKLAEMDFAVEIARVQEVITLPEVRRVPRAASFIDGVISLRGEIIPIVDLRKLLWIKSPKTQDLRAIIYSIDGIKAGYVVDEASNVMQIQSRQILTPPPVKIKGLNESCIKGIVERGETSYLLLDLKKTISQKEIKALGDVTNT